MSLMKSCEAFVFYIFTLSMFSLFQKTEFAAFYCLWTGMHVIYKTQRLPKERVKCVSLYYQNSKPQTKRFEEGWGVGGGWGRGYVSSSSTKPVACQPPSPHLPPPPTHRNRWSCILKHVTHSIKFNMHVHSLFGKWSSLFTYNSMYLDFINRRISFQAAIHIRHRLNWIDVSNLN